MNPATPSTALIIVDHGSRREESNAMHEQLVAMVAAVVPYEIVEPAHMELAEPSIAAAFARCVAAGATRVIISPYFLLPGRHWSTDIPALAAAAAADHPAVAYLVTAPLGLHRLMAQVVAARIAHCVEHAEGRADECEVCFGSGRCALRGGV